MSDNPNKTPDDAVARVNQARVGSLTNEPTIKYLLTLSREITKWREKVNEAIDKHPHYGTPDDDHPRLEYC